MVGHDTQSAVPSISERFGRSDALLASVATTGLASQHPMTELHFRAKRSLWKTQISPSKVSKSIEHRHRHRHRLKLKAQPTEMVRDQRGTLVESRSEAKRLPTNPLRRRRAPPNESVTKAKCLPTNPLRRRRPPPLPNVCKCTLGHIALTKRNIDSL